MRYLEHHGRGIDCIRRPRHAWPPAHAEAMAVGSRPDMQPPTTYVPTAWAGGS
jgi:hypothetical protein